MANVLTVRNGVGLAFEVPTNNDGPLTVEIESVPSGAPGLPVDVDASPAAVGASSAAATADHKHHLAVGSPVAVGLANADGVALSAARADHVHALTAAVASQVYATNWAVADWYIDGTTGNDANNGTTALTPLRTGAELLRRLGPYALWGQSVTVHVLANGMTDALVLRGVMLVAGTHLDVVGTATQLADAGTVASYAAVNHATPTASQLTATGIADWTPYQWQRIRSTSGPRAGLVAWIATSNPGGVGVATARISPPIMVDITNNASNTISAAFVVGDPIVVESVPVVPELSILLDGPISTAGTSQYARRLYSVQNVDCPVAWIVSSADAFGRKSLVFGCALSAIGQANGPNTSGTFSIAPTGCLMYCADLSQNGVMVLSVRIANCLIGRGITLLVPDNGLNAQNVLCQSAAISATGAVWTSSSTQIFDVVGATSVAFSTRNALMTNLSGSGNAGIGVGINNAANCRLNGTINLTGAVTNARLLSAPTVDLTLPQLLQPDDYAQRGVTPAMVAGTTTVTVAQWYDNTTQRVTATHAAFAGTPGILSVQQISNTQFTITSSSALDTSTVNWQISPLGRNIFVSTA